MAKHTVNIAGVTFNDVPYLTVTDGTSNNNAWFIDDATDTANDILTGKTAYAGNSVVTGVLDPFVKDISEWSSVNLATTQSGLFTSVVAAAGNARFQQDTANRRINIQYSNNGRTSGFLVKMPVNNGLAVHFASNSTIWTNTTHFNNWFGLGFDSSNFTATVSSVNPFDFGWASNRSWSALAMFFQNGGWMVADGLYCYFLDNNYNIIVRKSVDTTPTNLWFSDQASDSGSLNTNLYVDQIKRK